MSMYGMHRYTCHCMHMGADYIHTDAGMHAVGHAKMYIHNINRYMHMHTHSHTYLQAMYSIPDAKAFYKDMTENNNEGENKDKKQNNQYKNNQKDDSKDQKKASTAWKPQIAVSNETGSLHKKQEQPLKWSGNDKNIPTTALSQSNQGIRTQPDNNQNRAHTALSGSSVKPDLSKLPSSLVANLAFVAPSVFGGPPRQSSTYDVSEGVAISDVPMGARAINLGGVHPSEANLPAQGDMHALGSVAPSVSLSNPALAQQQRSITLQLPTLVHKKGQGNP
jgi:hypothetical protein